MRLLIQNKKVYAKTDVTKFESNKQLMAKKYGILPGNCLNGTASESQELCRQIV